MVVLSDEQVVRVETQIKNEVKMRTLQIELLDHYCCEIEQQMSKGADFEDAFQRAFELISPNGMGEIEEETYFFIHLNQQITMKRILYLAGFGASFCMVLGILMRFMHWPNAEIVNFAGSALLVVTLITLTAMLFRNLKYVNSTDIFRIGAGAFGGISFGIGLMFKILHFPGAGLMITIGLLTICFFFLPVLFWQMYKRSA